MQEVSMYFEAFLLTTTIYFEVGIFCGCLFWFCCYRFGTQGEVA